MTPDTYKNEFHDMPMISGMRHAWETGMRVAEEMKVGDVFRGAIPEGEARFKSKFLRDMFMHGYLYKLKKPIECEWGTNIITRLG